MVTTRAWVMTLWDDLNHHQTKIENELQHMLRYFVAGEETCPETGRKHLQCFAYFNNPIRFSKLDKLFPKSYIAPSKDSLGYANAIEYCKKENNFWEIGKMPQSRGDHGGSQTTKSKWEDAKNKAILGLIEEIPADFYIKYYKTFKAIASDHQKLPDDLPPIRSKETKIGSWYYGKAGTGKTKAAIEENPGAYRKNAANKWWDNYNHEQTVIIDDLDKSHQYQGYYLKIWADRYAFNCEIKGGGKLIRPKKVVVTSNWHPREIWSDEQILEPILRRFNIVRFTSLNEHLFGNDEEQIRIADEYII